MNKRGAQPSTLKHTVPTGLKENIMSVHPEDLIKENGDDNGKDSRKESLKEQARQRYTYYPPKTDQQKQDHADVNEATIAYHEKLIDILPPYADQHEDIRFLLSIVRNKANEALAWYNNRLSKPDPTE